jgi:integrase
VVKNSGKKLLALYALGMGNESVKRRNTKGTIAISFKTIKTFNQRTGRVDEYEYVQASKLVAYTDEKTGEIKKKRITASSKHEQDAIQKLNKKLYGVSSGTNPVTPPKPPKGETVEELLLAWLEVKSHSRTVRGEVSRKYKSYLDRHLIPDLGHLEVSALNDEMLTEYFDETLADKRKTKKIGGVEVETNELYFTSTSSILNIYKALNGALNLAVKRGKIPRNPMKLVDAPPAQKRKDNIPQLAHKAVNLLKHLKDDAHPDYCRFLLPFLGLRSGERLGIQLADIKNISSKTECRILIHSQLEYEVGVGWWINPETKSGRERSIPVPEPFYSALKDYVKTRKAWAKQPGWNPDPKFSDLLFLQSDGKLINKKQDTKDWHKIFKEYGY